MGFHRLRVAEESIPQTAFRILYNFYEWLVMPFSLINATSYFVDLMNRVFRDVLDKFMLVFIDDNLVYSKIEVEHKCHLRIVLKILREHEIKAKFSKCYFWCSKVKFLEHV